MRHRESTAQISGALPQTKKNVLGMEINVEEKQGRLKKFAENTVIVKEGEIQTDMYKILSGKAAVYINYGKKNEYLLGLLSEQKCFGEICILCNKPSPYTVVAVYDVLAMRVSENEFDEFIQNNTRNASDIIKSLAREVVNLRLNLDMVFDDIENGDQPEKLNIPELKQQINKYAIYGVQGEPGEK